MKAAIRALLFVWAVVYCCPVEFFAIGPDVDASWQLGLNLAAEQDLRFGEDVVWPSGPYAYLDSPMPVGDNLAKALIAQLALWLLAALALADVYFLQRLSLRGLAVLTACLMIGAPLFHFNTQGMDNLLGMTALWLAASATVSDRWRGRLGLAAIAAGAAVTLKLSAAVIAGLGVFVAGGVLALRDRRQGLHALGMTVLLGPLAGALAYWSHNPSLDGLAGYFSSMLELAAGYPLAMSVEGPADEMWMALAVGAAFFYVAWTLVQQRQRSAGVALLFLLPLLISFKHGFVRQDVHIANYFCFAAIALGVTLAFAERKTITPHLVALLVMPVLFVGLRTSVEARAAWVRSLNPLDVFVRTLTGAASLEHLPAALDLQALNARLLKEGHAEHREVGRELPSSLAEHVGRRPVAVLSPYFGIAHQSGLELRIPGVIQKYSAYTPKLDGFLAEWIESKAPDLLLFEWIAIDGRHPLLETPRSWTAVWHGFDTVASEGDWVLLERREQPRFSELVLAGTIESFGGIEINVPSGPVVLAVEQQLTFSGRAVKALLRIGPVTMQARRSDGSSFQNRVLPAMLASPGISAETPMNTAELAQLLCPSGPSMDMPTIESIDFGGSGLRWFEDLTRVQMYRREPVSTGPAKAVEGKRLP